MVDTKECTLMFYFASDNPLAISVVSQLKAIKAAGFHKQANVVVQFDPYTEGTPTHIFDVNLINKVKAKEESRFPLESNDPSERNLIEDKLWNGQLTRDGKEIRTAIAELLRPHASNFDPPQPPIVKTIDENGNPQEYGPKRSLNEFLNFCAQHYPAKHYLLFILGHGAVVGNDVFLFDENADEHTLDLKALREALEYFKSAVKEVGEFDFIGFHSCSVASLEVAYELRDIAKYMMASQGTAFVGSWPYRQILMHVFDNLNTHKELTESIMKQLLIDTFYFCMHNSADFILAGYPFDLSLFDLRQIKSIEGPLERLSKALVRGIKEPRCVDLIQLAHLKSQSFFQEMYTDLYDFCFCLSAKIAEYGEQQSDIFKPIFDACADVRTALTKQQTATKDGRPTSQSPDKLIVCSEFAGAEYQYARGLSLYFPWSAPISTRRILEKYAGYRLSKEFGTSWFNFLNEYLFKTRRDPSRAEQLQQQRALGITAEVRQISAKEALAEDKVSLVYMEEGPRGAENALDPRGAKTDAQDPTGINCSCPSIKNYPSDIRNRKARLDRHRQAQPDSAPLSENMVAPSAI